jgi:hypothetical protein
MNLRVHTVNSIKPNSWLLRASGQSEVWAGRDVDARPDAFFEGAWAGTFHEFKFYECAEVFGSGAAKISDSWLVISPSHTLEAVYALHDRSGDWTVSNSLGFLKNFLKFSFQDSFIELVNGFYKSALGIDHSPSRLRTSIGTLYVLRYYNALLARDGLIIRTKLPPPHFRDFCSYRSYLLETVCKVATNAAAPERNAKYELLTTISTGYDSPTCSALASEAGCKDAITILSSQLGLSDDGTPIAEKLGLRVSPFSRPSLAGENRQVVADLFSTGMQAADIVYEPLQGKLSRKLLVTGFHGDRVWDKNGDSSPLLKREGNPSGTSLTEFRLSESFIHLPVPFIGAVRHPEIKEISNSAEMARYSLGGTYDRPIARRILEESGVSREMFAQSKKAISILAFIDREFLKKEIRDEIGATFQNLSLKKKLAYIFHSTKFRTEKFAVSLPDRLTAKFGVRTRWLTKIICWTIFMQGSHEIWEHSDPFNGLAFEWALSIVAQQYEALEPDISVSRGPC